MTDFSYGQLEGLWEQAGGPKNLAPLMAAIAMAESGGNSQAQNPSGASGLWQILGAPDGWTGSTDWFNPENNAKAAVAKFKTQGLGAWTTYTSGAYKKFLKGNVPATAQTMSASQAQDTSASGGGGGAGLQEWLSWIPGFGIPLQFLYGSAGSVADVATGVAEIEKVVSEFFHYVSWLFVPAHWLRIICFFGGVSFTTMGLIAITFGTKPIPVSAGPVSTQVSGGGIAPAIGIAEITFGAMLLFFAFHNLESEGVTNLPGLLAYVREKAGGAAAAKAPVI